MAIRNLPPLSLYIHVPWCVRKCPYCDFNSHETKDDLPEVAYLDALIEDLTKDLDYVQGRSICSVFIGGGTPSIMSASFYQKLFVKLGDLLDLGDIEITMEANPGTFEQQRFSDFRMAGINRLSIGVQSFDDQHLKTLGRIHHGDEAYKAISQAQAVGFDNINIDLMHGLPMQGADQAMEDIQKALSLNPAHLSWYQLTIEPNTVFYRNTPVLPTEDVLCDIQDQGVALLDSAGFSQYEISAYSRSEKQSQHNINYWTFGDYLAVGAGAHGKVTLLGEQKIIRYQKTRTPKDYLESSKQYTAQKWVIPSDDLPLEYMMNRLRLRKPFTAAEYECRTGLLISSIEPLLKEAEKKGLMSVEDAVHVTDKGFRYLNNLLEMFS